MDPLRLSVGAAAKRVDSAARCAQVDRLECSREQALRKGGVGVPALDARTADMFVCAQPYGVAGQPPQKESDHCL